MKWGQQWGQVESDPLKSVAGQRVRGESPTHDEAIVPDASLEDLDNSLIETYIERLRQIRPRAGFLNVSKSGARADYLEMLPLITWKMSIPPEMQG